MTETIYRQLQERLDLYSMGFPAAKSGIEIKILKYLGILHFPVYTFQSSIPVLWGAPKKILIFFDGV